MPIYLMAGVWKKFDPEVMEGYVGACSILEKGQARVQVLGDSTVRMICYGGTARILPPLYVTDVPREWIQRFRQSRQDALEIIHSASDKPEEFAIAYTDAITHVKIPMKVEKDVAEDALEEWDKGFVKDQDPEALSRWKAAAVRLRDLISSMSKKG